MTFGYTVWGGKLAMLAGWDISQAEFWQWPGPKHALTDSVLGDTASLTDLGMIISSQAIEPFFDRGYFTANPQITQELLSKIEDPKVRALPQGLGSIEQWCDNSNLMMNPKLRLRAAPVYGGTSR